MEQMYAALDTDQLLRHLVNILTFCQFSHKTWPAERLVVSQELCSLVRVKRRAKRNVRKRKKILWKRIADHGDRSVKSRQYCTITHCRNKHLHRTTVKATHRYIKNPSGRKAASAKLPVQERHYWKWGFYFSRADIVWWHDCTCVL